MRKQIGLQLGVLGCASAALLLSAQQATQAELLTNANLDTTSVSGQTLATPTGWTAAASKTTTGPFNDGMSSETFCNVLDAGGSGVFFKAFQGSATTGDKISAILYQDVPATPGTTYFMKGWAGAGAGYIGLTDPTVQSQFQLQFLTSGNIPLSTNTLDLIAAGLGQGSPTPPATNFGYHQFSLSATAPAGAAKARVIAAMNNAYNNPAGGDQAFVVDAFSLNVPEPASLGLIGAFALPMLARRRRQE